MKLIKLLTFSGIAVMMLLSSYQTTLRMNRDFLAYRINRTESGGFTSMVQKRQTDQLPGGYPGLNILPGKLDSLN